MLTLNSKALKIGNKWLNPVNGSGPVPQYESYLLRVWTSHDMQITFQKLILNDVDPTTVDYSVLPSGKRPTDSPVDYCPPLVNNITLRFAYNNDSYSLNSQIQEFVNGGNVDTYPDYSSYLQDHRYDAYVDIEFEWPYSFPIQSSGSLALFNGGRGMLYKIVNDTHYAEIASFEGPGNKTFSIDQTVYDVNADSSLSLWPSAGASGDVLQIDWTPPTGQSLSSFSVNGGTVSNGLLTVGNSGVTLQANYGSYASYSSYELEIESANHPDSAPAFYISNMSATPASGTVTSQYGTEALNSSQINSITGDGPYNMTSGYGYDYKINLFFSSLNSQYISWNSYLAKNNTPCIGGTVTARLYGYNNGIRYPLGVTSYNPNNIMYNYKVSRCTDPNQPVYTVTTSASNGTVTATPPGGVAGTQCTITATPNTGYVLDHLSVLAGTGATLSGNILTLGNANTTVYGYFTQMVGYDHYEVEFLPKSDGAEVGISKMNIRPTSAYTKDVWNQTQNLSSSDLDKMTSSSTYYRVSLSTNLMTKLVLNFTSITGGTLSWYDAPDQWSVFEGGFGSATLYGVDSNNNRTQLSQIGPIDNTYNVERSLHV